MELGAETNPTLKLEKQNQLEPNESVRWKLEERKMEEKKRGKFTRGIMAKEATMDGDLCWKVKRRGEQLR